MAYNSYFPATYQPYYPQYPQQPQMQQPQQMMTPPTIRAEIVQVGNRSEAANFPVGAGQTQMMIAKDDSAIYIKTAFANGQANLDEYVKKPHESEKPVTDYVTREEFEQRLSAIMANQRRVNDEQSVSISRSETAGEPNANGSAIKV